MARTVLHALGDDRRAAAASKGASAPEVTTSHGIVEGRWHRGALFYGGIPYAAPPVGPLRFRPPEPASGWVGRRDGRSFGSDAVPQHVHAKWPLGNRRSVPSEDCLYLNVQTPSVAGRRPVMVWLHGGSFVDGSGSQFPFEGCKLARTGDVVVVTGNYRLGALGWLYLGHRDERFAESGNLGLLDQIALLEWVRDNIGEFGGDPGNVTIFGSSAGAMSLTTLLGVPAARGLFHRAIAQSGSGQGTIPRDDAMALADATLAELGLRRADDLVGVEPRALVGAAQAAAMRRALTDPPSLGRFLDFGPVVDGLVLHDEPIDAITDEDRRRVPVLVGTNRDECSFFTDQERDLTDEQLRHWLGSLVGEAAGHVYDVYRRAVVGSPADVRVAIDTDRRFRVPAVRLAERHVAAGGTAYLYRFDWCLRSSKWGACHSLEQPFVFDCLEPWLLGPYALLTGFRAPLELSGAMGEAWTRFAHGDEPAAAWLPDWPAYDGAATTMVLDRRPRPIDRLDAVRLAVWDDLL